MGFMPSRRCRPLIAAALAGAGWCEYAAAQVSGTWTGLAGTSWWTDGGNWTSNPQYPSTGGTATFTTPIGWRSDGIVPSTAISAPIALAEVHFRGPAAFRLTPAADTLALVGSATIDVEHPRLDALRVPSGSHLAAAAGQLIGGGIAGSAGLTKTGPGKLILSGTNTFTGSVRVQGGVLTATNAALSDSSNELVLANGAMLEIVGPPSNVVPRSIVVEGASGGRIRASTADLTFSGTISGTAPFALVGDAPQGTFEGGGYARFTGNSTYSGPTHVGLVTMVLAGPDGAIASSSGYVVDGYLQLDNQAFSNGDRIGDADVRLRSGALMMMNGSATAASEAFGALHIEGGRSWIRFSGTGAGTLTATDFVRSSGSVLEVGGLDSYGGAGRLYLDGMGRRPPVLIGNGNAGTPTVGILPGVTAVGPVGGPAALVTYDAARGVRALSGTEVSNTIDPAQPSQNVRLMQSAQLDQPVLVNSLWLESSGTNTVALEGPGTLSVASGMILGGGVVSAPVDFGDREGIVTNTRISGPVAGSAGVTLNGGALTAVNTYTGRTVVLGGITIDRDIPASGPGPFGADTSPIEFRRMPQVAGTMIKGPAPREIARDLLIRNHGAQVCLIEADPNTFFGDTRALISGDVQLEGNLHLQGSLNLTGQIGGPGRLLLGGNVRLAGQNTFADGVEAISGVQLVLAHDEALGPGLLRAHGAVLVAEGQPRRIPNAIQIHSGNGVRIGGTVPLILDGPLTADGGPFYVDVRDAGTVDLAGPIRATGLWLTRTGAIGGNAIVSGNSDYLGETRVDAGLTLIVRSDTALGSPLGRTVSSGTVQVEGNVTVAEPLHLPQHLRNGGGSNIWSGPVTFSSGFANVNVSSGTLALPGSLTAAGLLKAGAGTLLMSHARVASLTVQAGMLRIVPNGQAAGASNFGSLSFGTGARFDTTDNATVIDYSGPTSPIISVRTAIIGGWSGGAWDGSGWTSSLADSNNVGLGYAESAAVFQSLPAIFFGQPVDATALLVRLTRYGDANLDGVVNLQDFNRLASSFGQANKFWHHGDFNYDGNVNLQDFNRLASNFGLSAAGPEVTPADWARLAAAVPEPRVASLFGVAASAAMCRRRRPRSNRKPSDRAHRAGTCVISSS